MGDLLANTALALKVPLKWRLTGRADVSAAGAANGMLAYADPTGLTQGVLWTLCCRSHDRR